MEYLSDPKVGAIIGGVIIIVIFVVVFVVIKPTKKGTDAKSIVSAPTPAPVLPTAPTQTAAITGTTPAATTASVPKCQQYGDDPNSFICESYTDGTLVTSQIVE